MWLQVTELVLFLIVAIAGLKLLFALLKELRLHRPKPEIQAVERKKKDFNPRICDKCGREGIQYVQHLDKKTTTCYSCLGWPS